jgi:hypothetical protein
MESLIGQRVKKKSGKPFKSTFWINTVKGIVDHPYRPVHKGQVQKAYTFVEDDSCVSIELVEAAS